VFYSAVEIFPIRTLKNSVDIYSYFSGFLAFIVMCYHYMYLFHFGKETVTTEQIYLNFFL